MCVIFNGFADATIGVKSTSLSKTIAEFFPISPDVSTDNKLWMSTIEVSKMKILLNVHNTNIKENGMGTFHLGQAQDYINQVPL